MTTTAADLAEQLRLLRAERAMATEPVDPGYLAELNAEIALTRRAYVTAAVIEIATPRLG